VQIPRDKYVSKFAAPLGGPGGWPAGWTPLLSTEKEESTGNTFPTGLP
jgi:hypothetical protein